MVTPPPYVPEPSVRTEYELAPSVAGKLFRKTFGWMAMCLLITALTAVWVVNTPFFYRVFSSGWIWALLVAEIVLVAILSARVHRMRLSAATLLLIGYSVLNGITLSGIFVAYNLGSIAQAFLASAAMFAAMAIYGAATKRDLTSLRSVLMMGLVGLIIAMIVNIFVASRTFDWIVSGAGVILFTLLTAYDVQKIKKIAETNQAYEDAEIGRVAVFGALTLYLDFINLFLYLIRLFGRD